MHFSFRSKPPWRRNYMTNVTNATLHPLMQALWGHMWKPCIVIFERNPLGKLIWHLALLVELMVGFQNENITWLNTHQCRGNTGISNSTGWRAVWWNFEFHFSNSAISYSIPFHLFFFSFFTWRLYIWCENVMFKMNLSVWMSTSCAYESNLNRILMIVILCLWWQCHRHSDDDDTGWWWWWLLAPSKTQQWPAPQMLMFLAAIFVPSGPPEHLEDGKYLVYLVVGTIYK